MNNYKKFFFSLIFLFFFVLVCFAYKNTFVSAERGDKMFFFNKNLEIGDKNEDVRELQKVLNENPATSVSFFDAGSPGKETDFFGVLTKNAVIKFQELYASDILRPFGLKYGTGFVGTATRLKLNSLAEKNNKKTALFSSQDISSSKTESSSAIRSYEVVSNPEQDKEYEVDIPNSTDLSSFGAEPVSVRVYNTSEYQVLPGDSVILTGEGFTPTANTLYLGESRSISNLSSDKEGSEISFMIPKDLPLGKYSIWVTNANGTSKSEIIKIYIVVTNNPAERPVVEKVEPAEATIDSEIIVSGKGFTASGNNIYSGFGDIMNIASSDRKTLKFKPSSMAQMVKLQDNKTLNIPIEIWFYVANENGYNKEPASFIIKF